MLTIAFNDEAYETAQRILDTPGVHGGIQGYTVDIYRPQLSTGELLDPGTFTIVGSDQRDDEPEVVLVVREYDVENAQTVGPELRLSWDTTMEVC